MIGCESDFQDPVGLNRVIRVVAATSALNEGTRGVFTFYSPYLLYLTS